MPAPVTNEEKFQRWVVQALDALRALPEGDGAFAALGIACGLHERFIDALIHHQGKKATPEEFRKFAAADLDVSEDAVDRFYNGHRLGLAHAFHPKNYIEKAGKGDQWGWEIAEGPGFEKHPAIIKKGDKHYVVRIDPWKFAEHVVNRWKANPDLHDELTEFRFGNVYRAS